MKANANKCNFVVGIKVCRINVASNSKFNIKIG